jgi:hypothetical protein
MKSDKEKEIDNMFKKGLEPPGADPDFMDSDWDAMEQMLDKRKKRPAIIYWLPILGSVAALLLLLIGWWLLRPVVSNKHKANEIAIQHQPEKQEIAKTAPHVSNSNAIDTVTSQAIKSQNSGLASNHVNSSGNVINRANKGKNHPVNRSFVAATGINKDAAFPITDEKRTQSADLMAYNEPVVMGPSGTGDQNIGPVNVLPQIAPNQSAYINKAKAKSAYAYKPQFALSVLASSDKNGVNSFQQGKPGNNAGLLFSVGLSKKLTISAGAIYSAKQYMTDFADYHTDYQFTTNPKSVLADCKMFDIPINIDYQLYNKHRNKISVGTGFSSYLMLNENYQFNYAGNAIGPSKYNVPNPDKYLFSIVNIQATYTRQINSKVGLTFEPYMKLPISAVGSSEVRLQSTGVAVGLTWNLNSVRP